MFETCEQFKDILRKYPQYGFPDWIIIHIFYNRLDSSTRQLLHARCRRYSGENTLETAQQLIEEMALNSHQCNSREKKKVARIHGINSMTLLAAQVEALSQKLDTLHSPRDELWWLWCGHSSYDYPIFVGSLAPIDQVDYVDNTMRGHGNSYSNTFNLGWRNHPNFSWSN